MWLTGLQGNSPFSLTPFYLIRKIWHYEKEQQRWFQNKFLPSCPLLQSYRWGNFYVSQWVDKAELKGGAEVWWKKKKKKSPTSCVSGTFVFIFIFFFAYYLTNLWGTLTLGHLKRCYGLSKDRFGSVSSVGYGFSLKINKRGAYLLLKGSYCFSFVSSSSQLCRFKQFWPCSWSPSLSSYVLLQHVMKYVFVWAGLSVCQMNRKRRPLLSCDWDKSQRKELGTFSLSAHLGICLFLFLSN